MIIAILAGRKGSKGFPGKNMHMVSGHPLSYYPLKAATDCSLIDKVYLTTDDDKLIKLGEEHGAVIIKRPAYLCSDKASSSDVYVHAYDIANAQHKDKKIDIIVILMCNAPCISTYTLERGIKILRRNPGYDSCVTVSKYNMWSPLRARCIGRDGLLHPFAPFKAFGDVKKLTSDRDSQGDVWFADMGASIIRPKCLKNIDRGLLPQKWMGQKIYPLRQLGGLDVDFAWQMPQVEYLLRKRNQRD